MLYFPKTKTFPVTNTFSSNQNVGAEPREAQLQCVELRHERIQHRDAVCSRKWSVKNTWEGEKLLAARAAVWSASVSPR